MAFPPFPTTTAPGDLDGQVDLLTADNVPGGLLVSISARETYSQNFCIILDGNVIDTVYVSESVTVPIFVTTDGTHTLIALPNGEWGGAFEDATNTAIQYYGAEAGRTIRFIVTPTLQYLNNSANVVVTATTGAQRGANLNRDGEGRTNWAEFEYETVDFGGGVYSLTVTANNQIVAYGESTSPVTATAENNSGLTVTATVTAAETGTAWVRWPEKYVVSWSFSPSDTYTINDDGTSNVFTYTTAIMPGNTYNCAVVQYDDNDNISSSTGVTPVVIADFPNPPKDVHYVSGNAASTDIAWTAPTTGAVPDAYQIFDSADNAENFLDTFVPSQTVAGTTTTLTSPLTPPFTRSVIVRSVYLGKAERNLETLTIRYDAAGNRIPPIPNAPILFGSPNATERAFAVSASCDPAGEEVTPDTVNLYVWPSSGAADWVTVYGTASVPVAQGQPFVVALDSGTLPGRWSNTLVSFGFRASASGVTDRNETVYGPVAITDTGTAAPSATIEAGA